MLHIQITATRQPPLDSPRQSSADYTVVYTLATNHNNQHTQVLDAMPELGPYEIRLGHTHILSAAISGMALPPGVSPASVMALLASASAVSAAAHGGSEGVTSSGGAAPGGSSSSASGPSAAGVAAGGASEAGGGGGQHGGGGSHHHHHGQQATQHQHGQPAAAGGGGGNSSAEGGSQSGGAQWGGVGGRAHTWPAIRVGLDGLGLDSTPVSRCRQCVLQLPGDPLVSGGLMAWWFSGHTP